MVSDCRTALKVGELFAGAGGLCLGFLLADHLKVQYRPIFAIDSDKQSLSTYKRNLEWLTSFAPKILSSVPFIFQRDVEKLNSSALLRLCSLKTGELDLLIGGPP